MYTINIGQLLRNRANIAPDNLAIVDIASDRKFNFSELENITNQVANALLASGVEKGDRVILYMMNCTEFVQLYFAIAKIGAIAVPLNWRLVANELTFLLKDAGAKIAFYGSEFEGVVQTLKGNETGVDKWVQIGGDTQTGSLDYAIWTTDYPTSFTAYNSGDEDPVHILYTSGTTGRPKGAVHTHSTAFWSVANYDIMTGFREADKYLNVMPLFHIGALLPICCCVYKGATVYNAKSFDPMATWEVITKEQIDSTLFVPAMMLYLKNTYQPDNHKIASLRWVVTGGAPVPANLLQTYMDWNINVIQGYGLSESGTSVCFLLSGDALSKIGSTGRAAYFSNVRLVDANGKDVAPNERGEVWIKGIHNFKEYWNLPKETAESHVEGWFKTGDVATMDEEGFVTIVDRIKDMVISGGENIYPAELENVLLGMEGIVECAVIGVKSKRYGESPYAIVVKKNPGITDEQIMDYLNNKIARFKRIVGASFVEALPRNGAGKILKRQLREQYSNIIF